MIEKDRIVTAERILFDSAKAGMMILDAGCGRKCNVHVPADAYVVGVDASQNVLDANERLNEQIMGDLEVMDIASNRFDAVICWDVLEHLREPASVLEKLVGAAAPGGLLILGLPNVLSLKGLVAKFTPLRFHVWFARTIKCSRHAGEPGHGPFKTYLRWAIRPKEIRRFARERGLQIEQFELYDGLISPGIQQRAFVAIPLRISVALVRIMSVGRIDPALTDFVVVLRKPLPAR
jgi:2-polyprenyl-3-methyl-5-hydroxy-6-metoxy-1,4-benzoquinol methylase